MTDIDDRLRALEQDLARLRVALEAEDFRLAAERRNEPIAATLDEMRKKYGL